MMPYFILVLMIGLSAADIVSTCFALRRGFAEANPVARKLFGFMGELPAAILLKVVGLAPFAYLLVEYPNWWPAAAAYCLLLAGIVLNNVLALSDRS